MGSLDQTTGSNVKRKIAIINVTSYTPSQIESNFNTNYGQKGWRIVQFIVLGSNQFILAEKEYE